jgi:hypothetical protein
VTKLDWNTSGKRYYESGVDRGVLYVDGVGVPWTGLISVDEAPEGGEPRPYYVDGVKYLNISSREEFAGTVNAFAAPAEFGPCDGVKAIHNGLYVGEQRRKQFGLCYRTRIGNDIDGPEHGYKLHLIYTALAAPSQKSYVTHGTEPEPTELSWAISTLAPSMTSVIPTAHMVVDSRTADPVVMRRLEEILYGTDISTPTQITPQDLINLFAAGRYPLISWGYGGSDEVKNAASPQLIDLDALSVSRALYLPGTDGNYVSTPDKNLLDYNSATFENGRGKWEGLNKNLLTPAQAEGTSWFAIERVNLSVVSSPTLSDNNALAMTMTGTGDGSAGAAGGYPYLIPGRIYTYTARW